MKRYFVIAVNIRDKNLQRTISSHPNIFSAYWAFLKESFKPVRRYEFVMIKTREVDYES